MKMKAVMQFTKQYLVLDPMAYARLKGLETDTIKSLNHGANPLDSNPQK